MSWSSRKKKERIFCTVYFARRKPSNIWVLSQCIVYWINFQNIYTFTNQNTLLHTLLLVVLKTTESLKCILKKVSWYYESNGWNQKEQVLPVTKKMICEYSSIASCKALLDLNCVWCSNQLRLKFFKSIIYICTPKFFWCCLKGLLY